MFIMALILAGFCFGDRALIIEVNSYRILARTKTSMSGNALKRVGKPAFRCELNWIIAPSFIDTRLKQISDCIDKLFFMLQRSIDPCDYLAIPIQFIGPDFQHDTPNQIQQQANVTLLWVWITLFRLSRWGKLAGFRPMIVPQSSATTIYNNVSKN